MQFEKDIERKLVALVKKHHGLCLKWVCPGMGGVPDRIVLLPGAHIHFIELKRPQGRPDKRQQWWANKLRSMGFTHYYIYDLDGIVAYAAVLAVIEAERS